MHIECNFNQDEKGPAVANLAASVTGRPEEWAWGRTERSWRHQRREEVDFRDDSEVHKNMCTEMNFLLRFSFLWTFLDLCLDFDIN